MALKKLLIEVAYHLGAKVNTVEMTELSLVTPEDEFGHAFWITMTLRVNGAYAGRLCIRPNQGYGTQYPEELSARGTLYREAREFPFRCNYEDPPQFEYHD